MVDFGVCCPGDGADTIVGDGAGTPEGVATFRHGGTTVKVEDEAVTRAVDDGG